MKHKISLQRQQEIQAITAYRKTHTAIETSKHFNISRTKVDYICKPGNREKAIKDAIKWNKKHYDEFSSNLVKYYVKHQDKIKHKQKLFRDKPETKLKRHKYYQKHIHKILKQNKKYKTSKKYWLSWYRRNVVMRRQIAREYAKKRKCIINKRRKLHTRPNQLWRLSNKYYLWSNTVYKRDNHTCQHCNKTHCVIHAHHIKKASEYPKLRYDINNGITLCEKCHRKQHSII